jgi:hypothetical protein
LESEKVQLFSGSTVHGWKAETGSRVNRENKRVRGSGNEKTTDSEFGSELSGFG